MGVGAEGLQSRNDGVRIVWVRLGLVTDTCGSCQNYYFSLFFLDFCVPRSHVSSIVRSLDFKFFFNHNIFNYAHKAERSQPRHIDPGGVLCRFAARAGVLSAARARVDMCCICMHRTSRAKFTGKATCQRQNTWRTPIHSSSRAHIESHKPVPMGSER